MGERGILAGEFAAELPLPESRTNELGSLIAYVDPLQWSGACDDLSLPRLPDPSGIELEPVRRLVLASRAWSDARDGDALGRMGEIVSAIGMHEAALDLFAAAEVLGREEARWSYFYGVACQQLGRVGVATEAFERALRLEPDYGTSYLRLGALHYEAGDLDAADTRYREASELPATSAAGLVGRGRVALEHRDFTTALEFLDRALRSAPRDYLAHRLRSRALAGLGRLEDARAASEAADRLPKHRGWLSFDPRLAEAHVAASTQLALENALNVALGSGNLPAARAAAEALLARRPGSADVRTVLARIVANAGDPKRAQELVEEAARLEPRNADVLAAKAEISLATGELAACAEALDTLRQVDGRAARTHQLAGRLLYLQGLNAEAIQALKLAIASAPQELGHREVLVDVLLGSERRAEARAELEAILVIDPSHARARSLLAQWGN